MRRVLFAGVTALALATGSQSALAADMPAAGPVTKAPPVAVAFNWTGCYVGGHVGYGWAKERWAYGYYGGIDYNVDAGPQTTDGFLGGGQLGCDYQTGAWVFGIEGDFSWASMKGSHLGRPFGANYFNSTSLDWIATATGRVGYAVDRSLFYVKGGAAWDRGSYGMLYEGISYSDKLTRLGWTIGAGWEYGLSPNWSVKLEYNFIHFGTDDVWWDYLYANDPWSYHVKQKVHVVKAGINYRFATGR